MFKNRLNLRNVAAIVACLAVFASCGSNNPNDDDDGGNGGNGGGKIDHPIVGVWYWTLVPWSWSSSSYSTTVTPTQVVTEITSSGGSVGGGVFMEVYHENGTGYHVFVTTDGYGWTTFNYSVKGNTLYTTKSVGTYNSKSFPSANYENRSFRDNEYLFKIRKNTAGEDEFVRKESFLEGTEQYNWTIDEYIEKGSPTWYSRLEED